MAEVRDPRAAELFWELLADAKTDRQQGGAIEAGLLSVHGIDRWYSSVRYAIGGRRRKRSWNWPGRPSRRAASGSDLQRLVALGLLAYADPDEAVQVAEKLQADTAVGAALRTDAFQIMLVAAPPKDAVRAPPPRLPARTPRGRSWPSRYFVYGRRARSTRMRDTITVPINPEGRSVRSGTPIVPKPPEGLQVSQIVPLLDDSDPAVAAEAGYLLALMGEARGLEPLLRYAQQQGKSNSSLATTGVPCDRRPGRFQPDSRCLRKIYAGLQPIRGLRVLLDDPHHDRLRRF